MEALKALQAGDFDRLQEACALEVNRSARKAASRHGILWALDSVRAAARRGVEKAAARYDQSRSEPFQAYARKDIYWEARRHAEAVAMAAEEAIQNPSGSEDVLYRLSALPAGHWEGVVDRLPLESFKTLYKSFVVVDNDRLKEILGARAFFSAMDAIGSRAAKELVGHPRTRMRDISGPIHMLHYDGVHGLERRAQREAKQPATPPLSNRQLAKLTGAGRSGATVKAWKERIELLGPPPEGGNLGLLLGYYHYVFDPRGYRRRHGRATD